MTVVVTHSTSSDASFSATGASAWDAEHVLAGVGTLAEQNANAVAITGGTINGATVGATTAAAVTGTTITASTAYKGTNYDATSSAGGNLRNTSGTNCIQWGAGGGTNVTISAAINMNGANAHIEMSPTGTGHVTINPTAVGDMDNMVIGATTPKAITGTTITATTFSGAGTSLTGTASALSIGGNAATATNGVVTTGSYSNPAWLPSVALTTGTITTAPSSSTDIVNKSYADSIAGGVNFHAACQYATTTALPANTYNNGTSGVGATLTATSNGALTVDGTVQTVANRVLVKNEVTQANNGVYEVTTVGDAGTKYVLTRTTDYDTSGSGANEIDQGDMMLVISGTANANTSWVQQTPLPITIGTTALVFIEFAATQTYTAGTGLTLATNQFSITNTGTAGTYGSASLIPVITTNAQGQVTSVTTAANPQGTVTSVTGTAPVVSSGGATPAISMAAASTSTDGYLTSTNWNTFNGKQAALVSATNIKTINGASVLGSGDLTVSGSFTGGTLTSQLILAAGTASAGTAPLELQTGTLNTTAEIGAVEFDGTAFYSSMAASTRGVMPSEQIIVLTSNNTLTSQTAAQPIFDGGGGPTNGAVTLPVGTYQYECSYAATGLSATSGSFGFALGGTATKTFSYQALASKAGTALTTPMATVSTFGSAAITTLVANSTGTVANLVVKGIMRVTVTGTVIPQVSLTVASAAVVQTNSYFKVSPIGSATVVSVGNWS